MSACNTGASGADVEGFCELNKLDTGCVDATEKNRYLEADTWRAAPLGRVDMLTFFVNLDFQTPPVVRAN